jgi:hypothetical protein
LKARARTSVAVDVAETAWNAEIEAKLIKDLKSFVG